MDSEINFKNFLLTVFILLNSVSIGYAHETAGTIVAGNAVCQSGHIRSGSFPDGSPKCVDETTQAPAPTAPPSPAPPSTIPSFEGPQISGDKTTIKTDQLPSGTQCLTIGVSANKDGECKTGEERISCPEDPNKYRCVPLIKELIEFLSKPGQIKQQVSGYQLSVDIPCQPIAGGQCPKITGPASYVARVYQFGLMVVGLLAFAGIIYGSIKYILSAGNMASLDDAKEQITQAIYGLLLLLGAFVILYTINPALVQLRNPEVPILNIDEIIQRGELPPPEQRLTGGGGGGTGAGGDPLCSAGSYTGLSLTIGGREQLPSFICTQCVIGAEKDSSGKCQRNPLLEYNPEQGYCTVG